MVEAPVLITGGAGFIGSNLVDALLAKGYAVRILDDMSTGKRSNLPMDNPRLELIEGDVADAGLVTKVMAGCSAVVHLAWRMRSTSSRENRPGMCSSMGQGGVGGADQGGQGRAQVVGNRREQGVAHLLAFHLHHRRNDARTAQGNGGGAAMKGRCLAR